MDSSCIEVVAWVSLSTIPPLMLSSIIRPLLAVEVSDQKVQQPMSLLSSRDPKELIFSFYLGHWFCVYSRDKKKLFWYNNINVSTGQHCDKCFTQITQALWYPSIQHFVHPLDSSFTIWLHKILVNEPNHSLQDSYHQIQLSKSHTIWTMASKTCARQKI